MNKKLLGAGVGVLLGALGTLGCGSDTPANLYTQLNNTQEDAVALLCECFAAAGQPDEATCLAEFGNEDTTTEQACLAEVYATYRSEALPATECELAVFDDAADCINDVVACDETAIGACFDAADAATDACPELPPAVETAIEACYN